MKYLVALLLFVATLSGQIPVTLGPNANLSVPAVDDRGLTAVVSSSVSPDGKINSASDLYLLDTRGTVARKLTNLPNNGASWIDLSSDGSLAAYNVTASAPSGMEEIHVVNALSGADLKVATDTVGCVEPLAEPARGGGADLASDREDPPDMAGAVDIGVGEQRGGHAWREIEVLPVGPGFGVRQLPVGADADAGQQQDEDGDRPHRPPAADELGRRRRRLTGWLARRCHPRPGRRASEGAVVAIVEGQRILPAIDPRADGGHPGHRNRRAKPR